MPSTKVLVRVTACMLFILGIALSWWPLIFLTPFVAVFYGSWLLALVLAWCADLGFGTPIGLFHSIVFPCTIAVILSILVRSVIIRHLR